MSLWSLFPSRARRRAATLLESAQEHLSAGRLVEASLDFERALRVGRAVWRDEDAQLLTAVSGLAVALMRQDRPEDAEPWTSEMLDIVKRRPWRGLDWRIAHHNAAETYLRAGKISTALYLFESLAVGAEGKPGAEAMRVEGVLGASACHRYMFAFDAAREAAGLLPESLAAAHSLLLGSIELMQNGPGAARLATRHFRRALSRSEVQSTYRYRELGSEERSWLALVHSRLSVSLHRDGAQEEAAQHTEQAARLASALSEGDFAWIVIHRDRGETSGSKSDAVAHCRLAVRDSQAQLGAKHPRTTECRIRCAELCAAAGDHNEARAMAEAILRTHAPALGNLHPWIRLARDLSELRGQDL